MSTTADPDGARDRVALVTGAANGLGRETSLLLAHSGFHLALTDLDAPGVEQTAQRIISEGHAAPVVVTGDIADPRTSAALVAATIDRFGRLDAVCNVAGMLGDAPLADTTVQQFERIMQVNCLGQLLTVQAALPALRQQPHASIVNVASVGALVALPFMSAYCASKAAVLGLTRAMAVELAPDIRVNALCPGGIDSRMSRDLLARFPADKQAELLDKLVGRQLIKRFAEPAEIARIIQFLISDAASFMTGAVLPAEGGHTAW